MKTREFKTTEDFVNWATSIDEDRKFKPKQLPGYDWDTNEYQRSYVLEEVGTGGGFRGMSSYKIPIIIGEALHNGWTKNKYGTTVGAKKIGTILKSLVGVDGISLKEVQKLVDTKKAIRDAKANYNVATYYFDQVQRAVTLLEQAECSAEVIEVVQEELKLKRQMVEQCANVLSSFGVPMD